MNELLTADFMLHNETGKLLYHKYAEHMPIYDYHCHVIPQEIWEDKAYENITQVWLYGDHYKWRVMRSMESMKSTLPGKRAIMSAFWPLPNRFRIAWGIPCIIGPIWN